MNMMFDGQDTGAMFQEILIDCWCPFIEATIEN